MGHRERSKTMARRWSPNVTYCNREESTLRDWGVLFIGQANRTTTQVWRRLSILYYNIRQKTHTSQAFSQVFFKRLICIHTIYFYLYYIIIFIKKHCILWCFLPFFTTFYHYYPYIIWYSTHSMSGGNP